MREIKFKYIFQHDETGKIAISIRKLEDIDCTTYLDFPKQIWSLIARLQYIDRRDKNGKEMYDGDIIRYNYHVDNSRDFICVIEYHVKILEIGYEHDPTLFIGFILKGIDNDGTDWFTNIPTISDIEIIGNKYEDPELLKMMI